MLKSYRSLLRRFLGPAAAVCVCLMATTSLFRHAATVNRPVPLAARMKEAAHGDQQANASKRPEAVNDEEGDKRRASVKSREGESYPTLGAAIQAARCEVTDLD